MAERKAPVPTVRARGVHDGHAQRVGIAALVPADPDPDRAAAHRRAARPAAVLAGRLLGARLGSRRESVGIGLGVAVGPTEAGTDGAVEGGEACAERGAREPSRRAGSATATRPPRPREEAGHEGADADRQHAEQHEAADRQRAHPRAAAIPLVPGLAVAIVRPLRLRGARGASGAVHCGGGASNGSTGGGGGAGFQGAGCGSRRRRLVGDVGGRGGRHRRGRLDRRLAGARRAARRACGGVAAAAATSGGGSSKSGRVLSTRAAAPSSDGAPRQDQLVLRLRLIRPICRWPLLAPVDLRSAAEGGVTGTMRPDPILELLAVEAARTGASGIRDRRPALGAEGGGRGRSVAGRAADLPWQGGRHTAAGYMRPVEVRQRRPWSAARSG